MKNTLLLFPILILLAFSGCSVEQTSIKPARQLEKIELDIFAARGFLGGSDYEHYTLKDGLLWRECGSIPVKKGVSSTGVQLKTLQVRQKRLESLKPAEQAPIIDALNLAKLELDSVAVKSLPTPESVKSMSDGGLFELKSTKFELATTVDAVGDGKTSQTAKLRALFEKVRNVGPVICDAQTFFGIGRR